MTSNSKHPSLSLNPRQYGRSLRAKFCRSTYSPPTSRSASAPQRSQLRLPRRFQELRHSRMARCTRKTFAAVVPSRPCLSRCRFARKRRGPRERLRPSLSLRAEIHDIGLGRYSERRPAPECKEPCRVNMELAQMRCWTRRSTDRTWAAPRGPAENFQLSTSWFS